MNTQLPRNKSYIVKELYHVDIPFNENFQINSFNSVYHSAAKIPLTISMTNSTFKKIPAVHTHCLCENNLSIQCVTKCETHGESTSNYIYDRHDNLVESIYDESKNIRVTMEYDALNRPVKLFRHRGDTIFLRESATYQDSLVHVDIFHPNGEIMIQVEKPYRVGQQQHIIKVKKKNNNKKVIFTSIDSTDPKVKWLTKFKLDDKGNWTKKIRYRVVNNKAIIYSRTFRTIEYKS